MNTIGDYALLGDCRSAALVGRDGSVDWLCFPRFDSPSVFAKILDADRGGSFSVAPAAVVSVARAYVEDTNVLVTTFSCHEGTLELTDCMPVTSGGDPYHAVLRRLRCTSGIVTADVRVAPRFEYGSFTPRFRLLSEQTAEIVGGADALWVSATRPLDERRDAITATWRLRAGEDVWIQAEWSPSSELRESLALPDFASRLDDTLAFWRSWISTCWYSGPYAPHVRRSALALKALTYAPTGAVVAAPTTSLPELIGGERNWDYRYTWIRDATLTLISLFVLGFRDEADAFKVWLERTGAGRPEDLQIMYGIDGRRSLPELSLSHLSGHRGSAPVRIGNGAVSQMQLDAYGQLLQAAWLYGKAGGAITPSNWAFLEALAEQVCRDWLRADHGIWEMRDEPRHFIHSKLNCWVALDRAVAIASARRIPAPVQRWESVRDEVRTWLIGHAASSGRFTQADGYGAADASVLLVPAMGLVPISEFGETLRSVRSELEVAPGLLARYVSDDGLSGGEGAFLLCSFWLLDCLTFAGHLDEASELLERLLGLANDVGLFAEEADPNTGEALGNMPQAFTHMALVTSCAHLDAARAGRLPPPDVACDWAEVALDNLVAAGRSL